MAGPCEENVFIFPLGPGNELHDDFLDINFQLKVGSLL